MRWTPNHTPWIRTLSTPERIDEDYWELIEHIRTAGQLESGDVVWRDSWFGPPVYQELSWKNWDKNAPERIEADKQAAVRREQLNKEIALIRERVAVSKAEGEQRRRDQQAAFFEWKRNEAEEQRLRREREEEQQRRDQEWEAAALKALEPAADAYFRNVYRTDPQRELMIRSIARQFPHCDRRISDQAAMEFMDVDWVDERSRERNNMSVYELLWRRTRFLAGYR